MEIYLDSLERMKIGKKILAHKYKQLRAATNEYEIVHTSKGPVKGRKRKNFYSAFGKFYAFEGIPYAKPPLGELRFRAPQPTESWQEVLDCTSCKTKAMQYHYIARWKEGSEDCLYLNIYAKELNTSKPLPVMVWIHGGGFQIGEATRDLCAPDHFMQRDMVLVTFAYRLGIFGFLCFDDPELNIPGNAGLKDQVLALRWVKENIHNFNGDPNNITVFGESAGGASTQFMMSIPQTKGLFHKAIIQSGSMLCPWAHTQNHEWAYKCACKLGYKGEKSDKGVYEYLNGKSSQQLVLRDFSLLTKEQHMDNLMFFFNPVVESYVTEDCITSKPFKELMANAWGNNIPLIIGGNTDEGFLFHNMARKFPFRVNELNDCITLLPEDIKNSRDEAALKQLGLCLKHAYFEGKQPNIKDNLHHYLELMGHRAFWHPLLRTIRARCEYAAHAATFCYKFDFYSEFFNFYRTVNCGRAAKCVSHADDLPYLFHSLLNEKLNTSSREYQCIQRMIGMWYNFALTSNPNCPEIEPVVWQPLADLSEAPKCLWISDALEIKELTEYEKCKVWDEFYTQQELI
uniref:carboxylesterase n=1 Tax=Stomoxys calcitrans TaxID=35570 RepID=A0A1I8PF73_STOCA|nr:unnamed protein product [Stomoxys calcitrans]